MKVLLISKNGDGIGIAQKLIEEGHSVKVWIQDSRYEYCGRGIVERVGAWRPFVAESDLLLFDMVGFGHLEPTVRKMGKPFLGCSVFADTVELQREKGLELLERAGIQVPAWDYFDSIVDLRDRLDYWPENGYYFKPNGNLSAASVQWCPNPETLFWVLGQTTCPFVLQEAVKGVEVSTEGWFNGRDWILPFNHTFEEKKFMTYNFGPNTGCQGCVVVPAKGGMNDLVRLGLLKLTPALKAIGYRGPIDLNTIVNEEGIWGLELTPRFGYDAIEALNEGLMEPLGDLLFEVALGVKKSMKLGTDIAMAVRLTLPPYPHADPDEADMGLPVVIPEQDIDHIYFADVMRHDNNYRYSASDGVVLKATSHGKNFNMAYSRVYSLLSRIVLPNKQYRTDIGIRFNSDWGLLHNAGLV